MMIVPLILMILIPLSAFATESSCYMDIERNFFEQHFLNQTLASHNISQSNWSLIYQSLKSNNKEVYGKVRQRAKKMTPNPFNTPFRPVVAGKILIQVQFEVFSDTLASFGLTSERDVEEMFAYIRNKQSQKLIKCFGEEFLNEGEAP